MTNEVAAIESLSDPARQIVIEARPADHVGSYLCANNADHGLGMCYYPGADGLCLDCAVRDIASRIECSDGQPVWIDVVIERRK